MPNGYGTVVALIFDVTGYPKEGGREGDLGGVISISLYR